MKRRFGLVLTTLFLAQLFTAFSYAAPLDNWNARASGVTNRLVAVTYANGTFVAVGREGTILRSTNGVNWVRYTGYVGEDLSGVTFGKGKFVAIGYLADAFDSADGVSWSSAHWTRLTFYPFGGITFANGLYHCHVPRRHLWPGNLCRGG